MTVRFGSLGKFLLERLPLLGSFAKLPPVALARAIGSRSRLSRLLVRPSTRKQVCLSVATER